MEIEVVSFPIKQWWIFPSVCKRLPEGTRCLPFQSFPETALVTAWMSGMMNNHRLRCLGMRAVIPRSGGINHTSGTVHGNHSLWIFLVGPETRHAWGSATLTHINVKQRKCLVIISIRYPLLIQHNYGTSPFVVGKSTISMAIFHSYVANYRRVYGLTNMPTDAMEPSVDAWLTQC